MSVPKKQGFRKGGAETAKCTSLAPASRSSLTIRPQVVPRTIESSISTTRLSFTVSAMTLSLMRTAFSRWPWVGWMKVRPT